MDSPPSLTSEDDFAGKPVGPEAPYMTRLFYSLAEANTEKHTQSQRATSWFGTLLSRCGTLTTLYFPGFLPLSGCIIDYVPERNLFKATYDDGSEDLVNIDEVIYYTDLTSRGIICACCGKINAVHEEAAEVVEEPNNEDNTAQPPHTNEIQQNVGAAAAVPDGTVRRRSARARTPAFHVEGKPAWTAAAKKPRTKRKGGSSRKPRTRQQDPSTYVPLSLYAAKADEYVWYT